MLSLLLAACGPQAAPLEEETDAGLEEEEEEEEEERPDARPRADARPQPDAAAPVDAAPEPDAPPVQPDAGPGPTGGVIADGDFEVDDWDSGNVFDDFTNKTPWGGSSWAVQAWTYDSRATVPDMAASRFYVDSGAAYMYAKEDDNYYALAKYVQGSVSSNSVAWNNFTPAAVGGKDVNLSMRVYRDTDVLLGTADGWVTMAVNLWFSSPNMPATGTDRNGKKPLVLDLVFHFECNTSATCANAGHAVETGSYHFRKKLPGVTSRVWNTVDIDVRDLLDEAIAEFDLEAAASSMKLYQAEVVVTVKKAEGALTFDDFELTIE